MSIVMTKKERKEQKCRAYNLTWNIDHGTMAQCSTMVAHIQAMKHLQWWEYAIEQKADGIGTKYHLHMEVLFEEEVIRSSLMRNILRKGREIAEEADPKAKVTGDSRKIKMPFDECWVANYCCGKTTIEGKTCEEVVKTEVSGPFKEEWRDVFPSKEVQEERQAIESSADEGMEKLAIEFRHWCEKGDVEKNIPFNGLYLQYEEGETNLEELCCAFLKDMMFVDKKMKVLKEKRQLVNLKQMFEAYVAHGMGKNTSKYNDWFATQREIDDRPANRRRRLEEKNRETNEFIKQYVDSD